MTPYLTGDFDAISHERFYNHNTHSLNMEHVGTLAEADDVLSPTIIPLFGLLSRPAEQEETCHFCFETITKGQFMILKLPCCGHLVHTTCFKTWASTSHKRIHRTLRLLQNRLSLRRHLFPLPTRIHRKTQLQNVLPYETPRRMQHRSHSPTPTPTLRPHTRMRTTYRM